MIGNDIVDLKLASIPVASRINRFLEKSFSSREQALILESEDFWRTAWLMWSMKESAYKIYIQQGGEHFFNPVKIECFLFSGYNGTAELNGNNYSTKSIIHEEYIYTTACSDINQRYKSECFELRQATYEHQHRTVQQELIKAYSSVSEVVLEDIAMIKNRAGVPRINVDGKVQPCAVSITHHGRYCGYALTKWSTCFFIEIGNTRLKVHEDL